MESNIFLIFVSVIAGIGVAFFFMIWTNEGIFSGSAAVISGLVIYQYLKSTFIDKQGN